MKKFENILFVTDLDGTLLKDDKTISKENLEAIDYFKDEGGLFTFITGRIPSGMADILDMVTPNAPYGCINGGGIYDAEKKKYLWHNTLPREALELVEFADRMVPSMGIQINTPDLAYFCKDNASLVKFRKLSWFPDLFAPYSDIKEPFVKVLFADEDEEALLRLISLLEAHPRAKDFLLVRSTKEYYEILPKDSGKGSVLPRLASLLGVDMRHTIAAGDNDNDVCLLRAAAVGVAVENATENAKKAANYHTVSNEDHAIAKIISDLDTGKLCFPC